MNITNISFKSLLIIAGVFLMIVIYFSCWRDYSISILKVAEPMQEKVLAFYKENQRYPNAKETQDLLKESGCSEVEQISYEKVGRLNDETFVNICTSRFIRTRVTTKVLPGRHREYALYYGIRNSTCSFSLDEGDIYSEIRCGNRPCIFTNKIGG